MKEKKSSLQSANGFESLIGVHTAALEENSKAIGDMLQILSKKVLNKADKKTLDGIKKELKRLDKELDNLGED